MKNAQRWLSIPAPRKNNDGKTKYFQRDKDKENAYIKNYLKYQTISPDTSGVLKSSVAAFPNYATSQVANALETNKAPLSTLDEVRQKYKEIATAGKTPTRDYFYTLGASRGMTQDDMDKLIGWNNTTKEVTFDGRSIGKPDVGVDGVSYWSDTSGLDKAFNDYVNRQEKVGKTATRDYLYSLGEGRGMSKEEIDSLIGWDNDTGEVTFGGKKIGKPDWAYDGVSYWKDTSVLDNAFNDWANRTGHTVDKDLLQEQHNTGIKNKVDQLWGIQGNDRNAMAGKYNKLEDTAYSNPFESDVAKAILGKYDLAALYGRDNAVASGSATNGGNIDSFAAANAMRQQAALTNQGQMAVLEAHNQKLNNIKGILESLGIYQQNQDAGMRDTIGLQQNEAQRLFENDETAKNNETERLRVQSEVTGITPTEWVIRNNPYLNADGTIKDQYKDVDFATVMAKAKASGDTAGYNAAATARYYKIMGDYGKYGKYDDGNYKAPGTYATENAKINEAARQELYSGISGTVGDTVTKSVYSNIWNADGSLKNYNQDFAGAMATLEEALKSTTDANEKARILDQLRVLEAARNQKIDDQGLTYGKTYKYQNAPKTADYDLNIKQMDNALKMAELGNATTLAVANQEAEVAKEKLAAQERMNAADNAAKSSGSGGSGSGGSKKPTLTVKQAEDAIKKGNITQGVIDAYNYYYDTNHTVDNPPKLNGSTTKSSGGSGSTKKYGVDEKIVKIGAYNEKTAEKVDLGVKGEKAIKKVISLVTNGNLGYDGQVSNYDLAEYLISNSDANDTNKAQLKKIFAYFGMDEKMLENVDDAGFWFWEWDKGVKTK